jgi:hypothetical protein
LITLESIKRRIASSAISTRRNKFKSDLNGLTNLQMVQKYITYGDCLPYNLEDFFSLKLEIATNLQIHPSNVFMVGSAKIGFSIKPDNFFRSFNLNSDIDIAIVDNTLFDSVWEAAYAYSESKADWPTKDVFIDYLFLGWIRVEKLPRTDSFRETNHIWDYFHKLTRSQKYGPFAIKAAIFKSLYFIENYQSKSIENCRNFQRELGE